MGFWAPLVSAISGLSTASKLSIASSVIGGAASYAAAKQQRKQAIADQDNQFVRMRNAAQRAGFNPLTVLRLTGGQGFTGLPAISKAAAFGNMATGVFGTLADNYVDKYEEKVKQAVQPKMTPFVKSKNVDTRRLEVEVSPKDWAGLNKDVKKQIVNAENIKAQSKIEGMKDTKPVFRAFGIDFEGSGAFSSAAAIEESLGDNFIVGEAAGLMIAGDALLNTASKNLNKNLKPHSITKRTGRQDPTQNYKIHYNDIVLGILPPLSRKYFITNGVVNEGYAR
jgi:hypothetical protein